MDFLYKLKGSVIRESVWRFSLSLCLKNTKYFQNRKTSVHDEGAELYKTFFKNMPGRILRPPAGLQCDKKLGLCFLCLLQVWLLFASINLLISKIDTSLQENHELSQLPVSTICYWTASHLLLNLWLLHYIIVRDLCLWIDSEPWLSVHVRSCLRACLWVSFFPCCVWVNAAHATENA